MIITKADTSIGFTEEFINKRESEINTVSKIYGFKEVFNLGFLTTMLHAVDFNQLLSAISLIINKVRPDIVYMNNRSDIHTDHQVDAKALISCTKSFRYPFIKKILMYECISETEIAPSLPENIFIPNVYSDITNFIDKKIDLMKIYVSEVHQPPMPRSLDNIKSLARYRGASSGVGYAEAFMLVRERF